jgi:hypothetical protein
MQHDTRQVSDKFFSSDGQDVTVPFFIQELLFLMSVGKGNLEASSPSGIFPPDKFIGEKNMVI